MGISEEAIIAWFAQYAYQPGIVYTSIITLMVASSFGFPVPEEVTLVSAGMICYMGSRPDLYPPPGTSMQPINVYVTAAICFFAVFLSDFLVFTLGRTYGSRLLHLRYMRKYQSAMGKVSRWTKRWGALAAGMFRFTPGIRFPGHFACGMLGLSPFRFTLVDGIAALFSVPTQVILVSYFGEAILENFRRFKLATFVLIAVLISILLIRRYSHLFMKNST